MKKPWVLSYTLSAQRRLWSESWQMPGLICLRWAHMFLFVLSCTGLYVNIFFCFTFFLSSSWVRRRAAIFDCDTPWRYLSRLVRKPTKWRVRPAKTQISLGIRPVWSESSPCAQWIAKDSSFLHERRLWSDWVDAQADLSLCWAHMLFCWFCHAAAHFMVSLKQSFIDCTVRLSTRIHSAFRGQFKHMEAARWWYTNLLTHSSQQQTKWTDLLAWLTVLLLLRQRVNRRLKWNRHRKLWI